MCIRDSGNVGTMIRTADAADYDGVFLSDKSADIYNQKTLRSMQGSHFHLPIYRGPILEMVETCKKQDLPVLATTLSEVSVDYKAVKTDGNFALVMGNEGQGISKEMAESANQLVHILSLIHILLVILLSSMTLLTTQLKLLQH